MNPPTPEDLVEAYHLVLSNHDEPVSWKMSESLWQAVVRQAAENGEEVPLTGKDRRLFDLPVEIGDDHPIAPMLYYRHDGAVVSTPIIGSAIPV